MRELEIRDLSLILLRLYGLPDDADPRVIERLKHMRKFAFPSAAGVGQGHRRTYRSEDVLKVAVAFQLIDAGLASKLAVSLVVKHWPLISEALSDAIRGRGGQVALTPNVVTDLSPTAAKTWSGGRCASATVSRRRTAGGSATFSGQADPVPSPSIILDLALMVRCVKRAIKTVEGVGSDEVENAFQDFASGE